MPFSRSELLRQRLLAALALVGDAPVHIAAWVGHGALLLLVLSGEAIRWVDYRETLVSAPTLRAVHALAGFALGSALLLRGLDALIAAWLGWRARRADPRARPAFHERAPAAARLLDVAWWTVVGLLVLSGLERYVQFRHGTTLLPLLPPAAWWALHRPLLPYLYALLLLNLLVRGRMAARRALTYLYTP